MHRKSPRTALFLGVLMIVPALALCRAAQAPQTLIVNGQPTQITVVQMNGHSYVDLEALARAANGSLSFNGNQITLTLSGTGGTPAPAPASANLASNSEFSKRFMSFVAISTDSDRNAYRLLNTEFENMKLLSNKYVAMRQSMQFIAPDSLTSDPLNQKILDCAHSMAAMAANGQFVEDGSCQ
jgi:hypothetical protein